MGFLRRGQSKVTLENGERLAADWDTGGVSNAENYVQIKDVEVFPRTDSLVEMNSMEGQYGRVISDMCSSFVVLCETGMEEECTNLSQAP